MPVVRTQVRLLRIMFSGVRLIVLSVTLVSAISGTSCDLGREGAGKGADGLSQGSGYSKTKG